MLDAKLIRNELEETAKKLKRRGFELDCAKISELESQRKEIQVSVQELQNERNTRSKSIGKAKAAGEDIEPLLAEVSELGDKLKAAEERLAAVQDELNGILMGIPNIPHESVP
ncbi:MAG: serine--tRNA ligase, partial [Gammaproteobacteria bacterium]|nr:serine--tRNA ligase [Gammaproteobacteria bacterium]